MAIGKEKPMTEQQRKESLSKIRTMVSEYDKHKNDHYAYFQREIREVRDLEGNARELIGFLLDEVDRLNPSSQGKIKIRKEQFSD